MTARKLWWILPLMVFLIVGCQPKSDTNDEQPVRILSHQDLFHFQEAKRCLALIKKQDRNSYFSLPYFWQHAGAGKFTLADFKVDSEDMAVWRHNCYVIAAGAFLDDLYSYQVDGDYQEMANTIIVFSDSVGFIDSLGLPDVTQFGTTKAELADLVITNKKERARRLVAAFRRGDYDDEDETKRWHKVFGFVQEIRQIAIELNCSIELFGITFLEIDDHFNSP